MGTQLPQLEGARPPVFGPCLLWLNGWMDEDATWYGSRPQPRPHCVRRGPSSPRKRGTAAPLFSAHVYCGLGRPSQPLLSSCCNSTQCKFYEKQQMLRKELKSIKTNATTKRIICSPENILTNCNQPNKYATVPNAITLCNIVRLEIDPYSRTCQDHICWFLWPSTALKFVENIRILKNFSWWVETVPFSICPFLLFWLYPHSLHFPIVQSPSTLRFSCRHPFTVHFPLPFFFPMPWHLKT